MAIDLYGLTLEEVRARFPEVYQHLALTVKVERELAASRSKTKDAKEYARNWWIFCKPRQTMRSFLLGLDRFVVTVQTAKHRVFLFLDKEMMPDQKLMVFGLADSYYLGILSSFSHLVWASARSALLGPTPTYVKSHCFDPFPFPDPDEFTRARIAALGEKLDAHRKSVQAAHPDITLTQMYNVLEKLKSGETLTAPEERLRDDGLILILRELHDELDAAVAQAYGWPATLTEDEILARLVALNKERAAEEAKGKVRWLRPAYQIPRFGTAREKEEQLEADLGLPPAAAARTKPAFPTGAVEQTGAVMAALAASSGPLSAADIAQGFRQGRRIEPQVRATLAAMARLGFIAIHDGGQRFSTVRAA